MKIFAIAVFSVFVAGGGASAFTLLSLNPNETGWVQKPLNFNLNPSNCPPNIGSLLNAATGLWNSVATSSLTITVNGSSFTTPSQLFNGTAPDSPVIVCDPNFQSTTGQSANTSPAEGFIGGTAQPINYGGLILNVQAGAADNVGTISTVLAQITVSHEMGHVLGLGHSADPDALMYFDATRKNNLALAQDDIDGITYLYPRNELGGNGILGCGLVSTYFGSGYGGGGPSAFVIMGILGLLALPVLLALSLARLKRLLTRKARA